MRYIHRHRRTYLFIYVWYVQIYITRYFICMTEVSVIRVFEDKGENTKKQAIWPKKGSLPYKRCVLYLNDPFSAEQPVSQYFFPYPKIWDDRNFCHAYKIISCEICYTRTIRIWINMYVRALYIPQDIFCMHDRSFCHPSFRG